MQDDIIFQFLLGCMPAGIGKSFDCSDVSSSCVLKQSPMQLFVHCLAILCRFLALAQAISNLRAKLSGANDDQGITSATAGGVNLVCCRAFEICVFEHFAAQTWTRGGTLHRGRSF